MPKVVIIRNAESDLVVEGTSRGVSIEAYKERLSQLWYMIATGDGSYTFRNKQSW